LPEQTLGSIAWAKIFAAAEELQANCVHCKDAVSAVSFLKDVINVKTGKPLHDKANFDRWMGIAVRAYKDFGEELMVSVTHD
jgi:hypothetical protein